jgi:hypothetical protein
MGTTDTSARPPRSTFVTVVAWLFIAVSALATPIAIAQRFLVLRLLREQVMAPAGAPRPALPTAIAFVFAHLEPIFLALVVVFAYALVTAIGLLMRKSWARPAFLALLVIGIGGAAAGFALQSVLLAEMSRRAADSAAPGVRHVLVAMQVFVAGAAVVIVLALVWLIARLRSQSVRAEFRA